MNSASLVKMPRGDRRALEYTIDTGRRLISVLCRGQITLESILDYERRVVEDAAFDPTYSELFDLSNGTLTEVSFNDVDHLVEFERIHELYTGHRKCAFVAPTDLNFGIAQMYASMEDASPMQTRVFRDLTTALEWLDGDRLS